MSGYQPASTYPFAVNILLFVMQIVTVIWGSRFSFSFRLILSFTGMGVFLIAVPFFANVGGSSVGVVSSPYQSSSLCYPGVSNSFIQPHQYHHPSKASAVIEDMNTTYQPHQNYHHYQNWLPNAAAASVTSPTATTASTTPIHVNYIMNSNVIHNYHAPQHYSYPPQSFQVCTIYLGCI